MVIGLDFGASTVDLVEVEKRKMISIKSFESLSFKDLSLVNFFKETGYNPDQSEIIYVTGGKSKYFDNTYKGIPVKKVSEINAIGKGAYFLLEKKYKNILAVSLGTGTCMVKVKVLKNNRIKCEHIGGTGVGGGTFLGLSKALLGIDDVDKLIKMFKKGNKNKVDLTVGEIVGSGIGLVKSEDTASNLGKLTGLKKIPGEIIFKKEDLAAGIVNLIGQAIAATVIFAAKANKSEIVMLGGKLTKIQPIIDIIFKVARLYRIKLIVPKKSMYISAIGSFN